jgi:hypothetical protein
MKEFVGGQRCRRVVLDEYIDGQFDRRNCVGGEQRCDVCQGVVIVEGRQRVRVVHPTREDASPERASPGRASAERQSVEGQSVEGQSAEGASPEGASPEGASPEGQSPDVEEGRAVANIGVRQRYGDEGTAEAEEVNKRRRVEEVEGMEKIRRVNERQERRKFGLAMEEAEVGDRIEGQFRFWQERCEICQIKGRVSVGY